MKTGQCKILKPSAANRAAHCVGRCCRHRDAVLAQGMRLVRRAIPDRDLLATLRGRFGTGAA
jgi:hypothetical protein